MRCLAACQTELAIRMLDEILLPSFEVEFLVESKPLARRLHDSGLNVVFEDLGRPTPTSRLTSHQGPAWWSRTTAGRASAKSSSPSGMQGHIGLRARGRHLHSRKREEELKAQFPELNYLALSELFGGPLLTEFSRSLTRLKVQQITSGSSATQTGSSSCCTTIPIPIASRTAAQRAAAQPADGGHCGVREGTRPENQRMMNLLDINIEIMTAAHVGAISTASRWSTCNRTTSAAKSTASIWSSITIPSSQGTPAVYKDIRVDYGSTSTILTEHLRAVDANISERTATAMLYGSSPTRCSSTGEPRRHRSVLVSIPLADATLIRKMEARKSRWTGWTTCSRHDGTAV